jgi:hypothetical protein
MSSFASTSVHPMVIIVTIRLVFVISEISGSHKAYRLLLTLVQTQVPFSIQSHKYENSRNYEDEGVMLLYTSISRLRVSSFSTKLPFSGRVHILQHIILYLRVLTSLSISPLSSGILRRVALVRTDVSEELSSYFIRVTNFFAACICC